MSDVWKHRCIATQQYFDCVQRAIDEPPSWWMQQYAKFDTLTISEIMSLIHPELYVSRPGYTSLANRGYCPVRGSRAFKAQHLPPHPRCETMQLWIYQCEGAWRHASSLGVDLADDDASYVRQDHLFPYAFGGVTTLENQGLLCGLHNAVKAHDVHVWPWERWTARGTAPRWAIDALARISRMMR